MPTMNEIYGSEDPEDLKRKKKKQKVAQFQRRTRAKKGPDFVGQINDAFGAYSAVKRGQARGKKPTPAPATRNNAFNDKRRGM